MSSPNPLEVLLLDGIRVTSDPSRKPNFQRHMLADGGTHTLDSQFEQEAHRCLSHDARRTLSPFARPSLLS